MSSKDRRFAVLAEFQKRRLTAAEQDRFRWLSQKRIMENGLSFQEEAETLILWNKATRSPR